MFAIVRDLLAQVRDAFDYFRDQLTTDPDRAVYVAVALGATGRI